MFREVDVKQEYLIRIKKETIESKEHLKTLGKALIYYSSNEDIIIGFIRKVFDNANLYDVKLLRYKSFIKLYEV